MTPLLFSIISMALIIISYIPYFYGMVKGKTRPNAITWLSWAITVTAISVVQYFSGGGYAVWPYVLLVVVNILVFTLAIKNGGRSDIVKMDMICFGVSMLAFVFWLITRQGDIAMILITISQFVAFVPTIRKTWNKPLEENPFTWGVNSLRWLFMIFAVTEYSIATTSNQIWWAFVYAGAMILILTRRKILSSKKKKGGKND